MRTLQDLPRHAAERGHADLTALVSYYLAKEWLAEETDLIQQARRRQAEISQEIAAQQVRVSSQAERGIFEAEAHRLALESDRLEAEIAQRQELIAGLQKVNKPAPAWL